jgi:hypothetical protein
MIIFDTTNIIEGYTTNSGRWMGVKVSLAHSGFCGNAVEVNLLLVLYQAIINESSARRAAFPPSIQANKQQVPRIVVERACFSDLIDNSLGLA